MPLPVSQQYLDLLNTNKCPVRGIFVAVDPGETTGIAIFNNGLLEKGDFLGTGEAVTGASKIWNWITTHLGSDELRWLVVEEYRVYSWKARSHSWSNLHTSRLIGGLDVISATNAPKCQRVKQGAQQAKGFCTDDKLRNWGYYLPNRHTRDAVRHGCFFAIFGQHSSASDSNPS